MEMDVTMEGAEANPSGDGLPNFLEVACFLREMLNDLIGGVEDAPGMRKVLEFAAQQLVFPDKGHALSKKQQVTTEAREEGTSSSTTARRIRIFGDSEDSELLESDGSAYMEPTWWSTLSKEILFLVVEKLSFSTLISRRGFSLEWKWDIDFGDSEFRQVCDKKHHFRYALIVPGIDLGTHIVMVPGDRFEEWRTFSIRIGCKPFNTMIAADGGLVCFVSTFKSRVTNYPVVLVVNPLTHACRELLPPRFCTVQPKMVQLVMNRGTKSYKVILVGYKTASPGRPAAQIFDSQAGVWMNIENSSGRFFGLQYRWHTSNESLVHVGYVVEPCAYDSATEQLLEFKGDNNPCQDASVEEYAVVGNRLFVLHAVARDPDDDPDYTPLGLSWLNEDDKDPGIYERYEYQGQARGPCWKKIRDILRGEANYHNGATLRSSLHAEVICC